MTELLPSASATALLQAMLLEGDAAREAWERCTLPVEASMRPLLPLLYDSVRRNALPIDASDATVLRSAFVTESLRSRVYREIVDELVSRLHAASIDFLLIKGAAVGELYYADPVLRHAHDVEIAVERFAPVRRALAGSRFRRVWWHFVHETGLPLRVHRRLPVPAIGATTLSSGARTLDATATLALALMQSSRWASDAFMIIRNGAVDWERFARMAGRRRDVRMRLAWLRQALLTADKMAADDE